MKNFTLRLMFVAAAMLSIGSAFAQEDSTYTDDFSAAHDYVAGDVAGTIWDGIAINDGFLEVEAEAILDVLNTSDNEGALTFTTTSSYWADNNDNGAFLYKNIPANADFEVSVKIVGGDFSSYGATAVAYLMAGPMVRRADTISFLAMQVFDQYSVGYSLRSIPASLSSTNNEENWTKTDANGAELLAADFPYLKLVREGSVYKAYCSADGENWFEYQTNSRPDMDGAPLQVGLYNATYTENIGSVIFDDFKLSYHVVPDVSAKTIYNASELKAYYSNKNIVVKSTSTISNLKIYSISGSLISSQSDVNAKSLSIPVEKNGVYLVVSESEGKTYTQKVVAY